MGIILSKQQEGGASLLAPSMDGNLDEVKRLVGIYIADNDKSNLSMYINATDPSGNNAIIGAVFSGRLDILSFLVESCDAVNLTIKNGLGCSPLWIAAGYDRIECLEYLIDKAHESQEFELIFLDTNSTGDTPFLAAASKGNMNACKCLLESADKYSSQSQSQDGDTELLACCWDMKKKILRTANNGGDTALMVAIASGQGGELVALLLETDYLCDEWYSLNQVSAGSEETASNEEEVAMHSKFVNRKNNMGLSPLIVACERNLPSIAELLLKHGADLTIKDSMGRNSLAVASFCGCNDVVEFLLTKTEAPSLLLNGTDYNDCTPLWLAARTGNVSMIKLLVDAGADATIKNNEDLSPYDVAVTFKKEKAAEYFEQRTQ